MFFSHLTTSITEVDIYLRKNPTLRTHVPKDLTEFKRIAERVEESMVKAKKKLPVSQQKRKEDELDEAQEKVLSGLMDHTLAQQKNQSEKLVDLLGWSDIQYALEWRRNQALMVRRPFVRDNRVAKRMGERFLVMSGLSWNLQSQNKGRDWPIIVSAVTLEAKLVGSYRMDLLRACPGACALRVEMERYFRTIASIHHGKHPISGQLQGVAHWQFPDQYSVDVGPHGRTSYDPDHLRKELGGLKETVSSPKGKRNGAGFITNSLAKNKLLWSSDPDAPHGSLETLAYICLNTLSNVSHLFISRTRTSPINHQTCPFTDHQFQLRTARVREKAQGRNFRPGERRHTLLRAEATCQVRSLRRTSEHESACLYL